MKIKANGISMNYEINGEGANLVLIHGAGDNLNIWYHQIPVFSKNYRVITYDVRGAGKTESLTGKHSMSILAEDLYELMKAIKVEDACFLGYSMGGRIALDLALNHPEMVRALIVTNSMVSVSPPSSEDLERRRANLGQLEKGDIKKAVEMMTAGAFSPGFASRNPSEFKRYMEVRLQSNANGLAQLMRSFTVPTSPPDLGKVKCPVLIIVGEKDLLMGVEQGEEAHKAIAGSRLLVMPTGHASAIEMPEEFNAAVLDFLSEVRSG